MVLFYSATTHLQTTLYSSALQCCAQVMSAALYAYTPEVYPTAVRTSGFGMATAASKLAPVIAPTLTGILLPVPQVPLGIGCAALPFSTWLVFTLPPQTNQDYGSVF
eukprot:NODE_5735_length_617_cov_40.710204_g5571_i0.p2 GENE.NODE_5735_length_617_cov_40.710204_g5571_i0~~NODE_5735_length_617_cov_40.710204_g5571_i0.p2  ORF type:complete len:107 (+),score=13.89 NODE_5735_length_617_cov_40.710204_g5571_i0:255-575(+)